MSIEVYPKEGMSDPQSSGELRKLQALFPKINVSGLRVCKLIGFDVEVSDESAAEALTHELAKAFLVQQTLEDYRIDSIENYDPESGS
ncbi:phosphoribosylformylglycinamidine synthase subunit PurS [Candidatus Saccharibacteria bacterium]|nr:phosphoribosylformylglycinamidine synthase subunit PurS [Candidatus Saccharibacteria bacterium]